ncbi:MAG: PQQ-dependent sugar dehydrogenase [Gemmatimonadota bacterium]
MFLVSLALVAAPPCAPDNGGLKLPANLCASVVARGVGGVRHLVVAPNGDVFVAVVGPDGGVLALRDADGDGTYETVRRFGPEGGNGIALTRDWLYFAPNDRVIRWRWKPGQLEPTGEPEVVVSGLPTGGHTSKQIAIGPDGMLYVNVGSRTNSCQEADRQPRSPGRQPCTELEERAGIWRFVAHRTGQTPATGERFATGIRNGMALGFQPGTGALFVATHGRDQLSANWGFSDEYNAENPAEELAIVPKGGNLGWPYCYYDTGLRRKVLAPEYGGDGKKEGNCGSMLQPAVVFPAHWGPMALAFAGGTALPPEWRHGVFVAFHGSWNRAPLPQQGFRVVFAPFGPDHRPTGAFKDFALAAGQPTSIRPSGVAVGRDGSVYIAADHSGMIWRVVAK